MRRRHLTWGLVIVGVVVLLAVLGRQAAPERVAAGGALAGAEQEAVAAAGGEAAEAVGAGAREVAPSGAETRVRVHVRDEDGIAIEGAVVTLWPRRKELQSRDGQPYARGETDPGGLIACDAVPGRWVVNVEEPASRAQEFARGWAECDLEPGLRDVPIVLARLDATVCVHVHDDLGIPLEGIGVEARFLGIPERTVKTDARGNAWFERVGAIGCRFTVSNKDLAAIGRLVMQNDGSFHLEIPRRAVTTRRVAVVRGATLEIEPPPSPLGSPAGQVHVSVYGDRAYEENSRSITCRLGAGLVVMKPLPPGMCSVHVALSADVELAQLPVPDLELSPGEVRRLVIPVSPESGRIGGKVLAPDGQPVNRVGVAAFLMDSVGRYVPASSKSTLTDRNGRFLIRGLPDGVRVLDVWVVGHAAGPFRYVDREDHHYAPGVDDVVIQLRVGHQIRGKLLLDGKPSDEGDVEIRPGRFRTQTDRASIEQAQFTFEHVRPGRHHLTWRIDGRVVCERTVDVPDLPDSTTVEVELSATR